MIQEIPHAGWKRNLRIQGATTELIVTLDVGPRILRYAFHDARNVFVEMPDQLGRSGENEWMIRGGHRFWTAPEADHCYELDNVPVTWEAVGETGAEIHSPPNKTHGMQKSLRIEMLENEIVRVTHILANTGDQPLTLSPWALSVMAPGGTAFIPQPCLDFHPTEFPEGRVTKPQDFLPNRELILWPFTNITDGRYAYSEHFLRVNHHPEKPATKIGLKLATGWIAYQNGDYIFAKYFAYDPALPYPDRGANFELFTNRKILELETLAPSRPIEPGGRCEHVEHWVLRKTRHDLRREKTARDFFDALPAIS